MSDTHMHRPRAGRRHRRPLAIAFVLVLGFMVIEWVAGVLTNSLSLISDAGHMATDALGLGMALAAMLAANRAETSAGRTYGLYRWEILAALANAGLLLLVGGYVLVEAVRRFQEPTEVMVGPMLLVAVGGLLVNLVTWRLLRPGAQESINVKGALLRGGRRLDRFHRGHCSCRHHDHDRLALRRSAVRGADWAVHRAASLALGRQALRILTQASPPDLDIDALRSDLLAVDGVGDVHDLHVWTLTSEMDVATVHLMTAGDVEAHPVLDRARSLLRDRYGIDHATLQVEPDTHLGCSDVTW